MKITFEKLAEDISSHFGDTVKVTTETKLSDVVTDSLELLELVMILEDHYDVNIANPHLLNTFEDLYFEIIGCRN